MLRQKNATYNFVGSAVIALSMILSAPIYLRLLGPEAFGLIGVSYTLIIVFSMFDIGLAPAMQREMARLSGSVQEQKRTRSVVRTLELLSWSLSIGFCAIAIWLVIGGVPSRWLGPNSFDSQTLDRALCWIAVQAAAQISITFYGSGLLGLQKQGLFNILFAGFAVLRVILSVALLWGQSIDIVGFFVLQAIISIVHLLAACIGLWAVLPSGRSYFDVRVIFEQKKYMLGMLGVTALATILTQIDKLMLSGQFSLEYFGYYVLAWNLAMLVIKPAQPIYNAYLPVLSQLMAQGGNQSQLVQAYHQACKQNAALIWPLALGIALFSHPILFIYSGSAVVADEAHLALTLLSIGAAFNATMLIPFALTQAYGWVSFLVKQNAIACIVIVPFCIWATADMSMTKAALGWFVVNLGYVTIAMYFMHRRMLPGELASWYLDDHRLRFVLPEKWVKALRQDRSAL